MKKKKVGMKIRLVENEILIRSDIPKHTNDLERTLSPKGNNLDLKKSLDYTY